MQSLCRHTKKNWKHIKMVKNVFWWPFLCTFNSCCICICVIAHCQPFLGPWMHLQVPAPVFEPDHSFLTHFWLLLSNCSYFFYIFQTIFPYSLSILPISNCLYLFLTVFLPKFKCYCLFYLFYLFFIIFNHFFFFSSPSLVFHRLQPSWLIFNHLYLFLTIFSNLQYFDPS